MDELIEKMVSESIESLSLPALSRMMATMQERVRALEADGYKKCRVKERTWKVLSSLGDLVSTLSVLPTEYTRWFNERCPEDMPELGSLLLSFKDLWDHMEEVEHHECIANESSRCH